MGFYLIYINLNSRSLVGKNLKNPIIVNKDYTLKAMIDIDRCSYLSDLPIIT